MSLRGNADIGGIHSVGAPIHIYPLYENGFRAHRGQSIEENHQESAILYGNFSQTAASNQYAWNYGQKPETAESIGTISKKNRMICFPCRLPFQRCLLKACLADTLSHRSTSHECIQYGQSGSSLYFDFDGVRKTAWRPGRKMDISS